MQTRSLLAAEPPLQPHSGRFSIERIQMGSNMTRCAFQKAFSDCKMGEVRPASGRLARLLREEGTGYEGSQPEVDSWYPQGRRRDRLPQTVF